MLSSVACPALLYSSTLSHKRHDFRKKIIEHKTCVLISFTTFISNISHSTYNWARYDKNVQRCWYVLSPTRKETSYRDRRYWYSHILFIIINGGILVLYIYIYIYIYKTRLASNDIFSPSNKIHREVGRAKDLSAPRYSELHVKYPLFLSDFHYILIFSTEFRKILKYQISRKSVQWEPSCSMRTNGQT